MLKALKITNLATIEKLHLDFNSGLTIISGETGSGKSLILDALGLVLGNKANRGLVRFGATTAQVDAVFNTDSGESITLSREITSSGKSKCKINNKQETLQSLNLIGKKLADIQGQAEHHSIFSPGGHVYLVDEYGKLEGDRRSFEETLGALKAIRNDLASLQSFSSGNSEHRRLLEFQIKEIESANITQSEDRELDREHMLLVNAKMLIESANDAYTKTYGESDFGSSSLDLLQSAQEDIRKIVDIDLDARYLHEEISNLADQMYSLATTIRKYRDSVFHDPEKISDIESRIELLGDLKRKYGGTLEAVLEYYKSGSEELSQHSESITQIPALQDQEKTLLDTLTEKGTILLMKRKSASSKLCTELQKHLNDLGMNFTRVEIVFSEKENTSTESNTKNASVVNTGLGNVEFLISTNPGEPMQPLGKIASGGEAARVMIALKAALTEHIQCPTLIFDEIDEAIGGEIAFAVGEKLSLLSQNQQIICITHLPQIASFADEQIGVSKAILKERMVTSVSKVENLSRITEIDRMLGGLGGSSEKTAQQMMKFATEIKKNHKLVKR
jgi:DNA repair protein RecN (Recombination protein N)